MNDLVKAGTANGAVARVLMVFLCRQGPFNTLEIAELSGVARGKTLRLALMYLEAVEGLVESSVSAHGALSWALKGSIELSEGRLKFSRQPAELEERLRQFFPQADGQSGKNSQPARGMVEENNHTSRKNPDSGLQSGRNSQPGRGKFPLQGPKTSQSGKNSQPVSGNVEENNHTSRKNSDSGVQNGRNSRAAQGKFPLQGPKTPQSGRNSQAGKSLLIKDSKSTDSLKTLV